jgi:glucose-6-phosphate 1-dehydrogenase
VMKANTPLYGYEQGTWGPAEVEQRIVPPDGWHNPVITPHTAAGTELHAA